MQKMRVLRAIGLVWVVIVLALSAYGYYKNTHTPKTPNDIFWSALQSGMTTNGITCSVHDNTAGRDSTQAVSLDLVSKTDAASHTTLIQNGATVKTDGVSTVSDDYVRYSDIRFNSGNKKVNFSSVLNVWGHQSRTDGASLFEQTALGGCVVPLGRLTDVQAAGMVADMQKNQVFQADFSHPARVSDNGIAVLRYTVTVPPKQYVPFMQRFAGIYGLHALNTMDAGSYSGRPPRSLTVDIAADNKRLYRISFTGQTHTLQFSDFGKRPKVSVPQKTIPMIELEQRLQSIK